MIKTPRPKKVIPLDIPPKIEGVDAWLVFGLDLSLSRTGWATMQIRNNGPKTSMEFLGAGSIKPELASTPIWTRSVLIGKGLLTVLCSSEVRGLLAQGAGCIFSFETPTPYNDFLTSLSRVVHAVLFTENSLFMHARSFPYLLSVNASTLRSLMGLIQRGAKNKKENIVKAYEFMDKSRFPGLDTDSCDAVLLSIVGGYVASILLGHSDEVPPTS